MSALWLVSGRGSFPGRPQDFGTGAERAPLGQGCPPSLTAVADGGHRSLTLSEGLAGWGGTACGWSLLAKELQEVMVPRASREAVLGFAGHAPSTTSEPARV